MSEAIEIAEILDAELTDLIQYPATLDFFNQWARVEEAYVQLVRWAHWYEIVGRGLLDSAAALEAETGRTAADLDEWIIARDADLTELKSARAMLDRFATATRTQEGIAENIIRGPRSAMSGIETRPSGKRQAAP